MSQVKSLRHSRWECQYHVVFIPKYRKKAIFGQIRAELGDVFRRLAEQKESRIEEGRVMPDHAHMLIEIPPKYSVSKVIGFVKGKSAIQIARTYAERKRIFVRQHFWARGYFVSTVGRDEAKIREYIRHQESEDRKKRREKCTKAKLARSAFLEPGDLLELEIVSGDRSIDLGKQTNETAEAPSV